MEEVVAFATHTVADVLKSQQAGDSQVSNQRVGQVIKGKWTIESLLGVGGMASVYAGAHRNGQRAALKILHADFAREKTICERFLREAYVSNKVNHPATVQVLDDDVTDQGEPFLIMELLEGETVRDAWKKCGRTMPVPRVLQICDMVLDCLSSCHVINVIHRDLKPANIFITNAGEIKVLDFGVAQMRDATAERTATGTALGTPAYMSPEQAMGLVDQLDGRADLFSVGAMMHALVTGHRINNGRTEQEALVMAATKPVPSVARIAPHLPIEVIQLVDKALAWDRRNRFADSRAMQVAVLEALAKQGGRPLPQPRTPIRPNEGVAPPPLVMPPGLQMPDLAPQAQPAPQVQPAAQPAPQPVIQAPPSPAPPPQAIHAPQHTPHGMHAPQHTPQPLQHTPHSPGPMSGPAPVISQRPRQPSITDVAFSVGQPIADNDPRVQGVRDLMKQLDRVLPSVRQFGWAHPATERTLRTAYEAFAEALATRPNLLEFAVRPYSFMVMGHPVWEPSPPFDAIPYNLFACGIRTFQMDVGITYEEFREVLGLFLVDPGKDLPPEDDLASAFWERALPHIQYETADAFAEGDAAEREAFYGESDEIEAQAQAAAKDKISRLEARAMAVSTDQRALGATRGPSPFVLDQTLRAGVSSQFEMTRDQWSERFVDALIEGLLDAAANRDAQLVLASLRKSAADMAVAGRVEVALQLQQAIGERLHTRVSNPDNRSKLVMAVTNAMFGGETLEIILRRAREDAVSVEALHAILSSLPPSEFPTVLAGIREGQPMHMRPTLFQYIERSAVGREVELGQAAAGADPEIAAAFVMLLGRMKTALGRQVLDGLTRSEDVNVRVEARVLRSTTPEQAQQELASMLESTSALVRMAALRTISRYGVRQVWPSIGRFVNAKNFSDYGADERREFLRALVVLAPDRGEAILLDIARKGGVLSSEGKETTRTIAADVLGDLSHSKGVASALSELSQQRWGVSDETRSASANAAKKIVARAELGGLIPV